MNGGFAAAVAAGWLGVVCVVGSPARAEETVSVIGVLPATTCAEAANTIATRGVASARDLRVCDTAINDVALTRGELAATYVNRGALHLTQGDYAAAIADNTTALRLRDGMVEALINRAAAFAANKQFANAVDDLGRALALSPAHAELVYYNRALAREDAGDVQGAYADYLKASQLDPTWDRPKRELVRFTVVSTRQ